MRYGQMIRARFINHTDYARRRAARLAGSIRFCGFPPTVHARIVNAHP